MSTWEGQDKASGASVAMDLVRKVLSRRMKPGSASLKLTRSVRLATMRVQLDAINDMRRAWRRLLPVRFLDFIGRTAGLA